MKRTALSILTMIILCTVYCLVSAAPAADTAGPSFGKWAFTGKDDKGVAWTGTLVIEKLDTNRFDAARFHSMCNLDMKSATAGKGIETPCAWDPKTREVSFKTTDTASYTAILSPDGKTLTRGKWTDSEKDFKTRKVTVIRTGTWSAAFTGR